MNPEIEVLRQTSSSRGQLSRHRDADVESDPELELDGCLRAKSQLTVQSQVSVGLDDGP